MKIIKYSFVIFTLIALLSCSSDEKGNKQILVYEGRQSVQCESSGLTPAESAEKLIVRGVDVIESYCGSITGVGVSAVCGAGTLEIIVHKIHASNLDAAEDAGFRRVKTLVDEENNVGYQIYACEDS